jgi:hypothetical protein
VHHIIIVTIFFKCKGKKKVVSFFYTLVPLYERNWGLKQVACACLEKYHNNTNALIAYLKTKCLLVKKDIPRSSTYIETDTILATFIFI